MVLRRGMVSPLQLRRGLQGRGWSLETRVEEAAGQRWLTQTRVVMIDSGWGVGGGGRLGKMAMSW